MCFLILTSHMWSWLEALLVLVKNFKKAQYVRKPVYPFTMKAPINPKHNVLAVSLATKKTVLPFLGIPTNI